MGLRHRIARAEKRAGLDKKPPCAACGGRVVIEEIGADGVSRVPHGGPCELCGSASTEPGGVSWLIYETRQVVPEDD